MQRFLALILFVFLHAAVFSQNRGGYVGQNLYGSERLRSPRSLQYVPRDGGFFCVNGKNRFTRALYGSHADYRIETSDKPIFAVYKPKSGRSLRFYIDGLNLDSVENCESTYRNGVRSYLLRDKRWGPEAAVNVDVMALHDRDGAVWRFVTHGFHTPVEIGYRMCDIANSRLFRNGDMGVDKPGSFEPSPNEANLVRGSVKADVAYAVLEQTRLSFEENTTLAENLFAKSYDYYQNLCSRLSFNTPDKWINTLGAALVMAADGVWDGETWLHGAIGWRMPLAGWRAGYLGDVMGWNDRAVSHFDAYAQSQVTSQPVIYPGVRQDSALCMARAEERWGTEMYSNGYICRFPHHDDQMHHYDMNLNYIDELLWHFQYDADTTYMKKMWPVIQRHLAWEKLNFDSDNDHLYDAYCCIWASDALYYSDGAVTHSSAYNYRGNRLAAKIARAIGHDPKPYDDEADAILKAINERLWVEGESAYVLSAGDVDSNTRSRVPAHWAEYQESSGNRNVHPDAALWSVYTPVDCGVGSSRQKYLATDYVTRHIPHIDIVSLDCDSSELRGEKFQVVSTSDWMPYVWSVNNVASAEIMHTALAYFEAGNADRGFKLLKSNVMDQMYFGQSPANFGQINYYDAARGECYRDFGDNVGISSRAIIQGLFGIVPQALDGECVIRPGFPLTWDSVEVKTPYLSYRYDKLSSTRGVLHIVQNFSRPLSIKVRINNQVGDFVDYCGSSAVEQDVFFDIPAVETVNAVLDDITPEMSSEKSRTHSELLGLHYEPFGVGDGFTPQDLSGTFNANVSDIFSQQYLSPSPKSTTLRIPSHGVGEWCHPLYKPIVNDSVFRAMSIGNMFAINGISFSTPQVGPNVVYTSLWDNYPTSVSIPVTPCSTSDAYLLLVGSTNHMQTHIDNALLIAQYTDGSSDTLHLVPPFNWCPIEQDYYVDGTAFSTAANRPLRICFATGQVFTQGTHIGLNPTEVYGRAIPGGAAQLLHMPLDSLKIVSSFTLVTLVPDVVVGVMAITL